MQASGTYNTIFIPTLEASVYHIASIEDIRKPEGLIRAFRLKPCDSSKMTREAFVKALDENKIVAVLQRGNIGYLDSHHNPLAKKHMFFIRNALLAEPAFAPTPVGQEAYDSLKFTVEKTKDRFQKTMKKSACVIL